MTAKIFTTKTCKFCPMVKKYLTYKGVKYEEIDINDKPELYPQGFSTVPLTQIGNRTIIGYNISQLSDALDSL